MRVVRYRHQSFAFLSHSVSLALIHSEKENSFVATSQLARQCVPPHMPAMDGNLRPELFNQLAIDTVVALAERLCSWLHLEAKGLNIETLS